MTKLFAAQPVEISGQRFESRGEAYGHVKGILHEYPIGTPITGPTQDFLLDLLGNNLKVNIARDKGWVTGLTKRDYQGGTALYVERSGMPPIVCSWRKAIQALRTAPPINPTTGDYDEAKSAVTC